jgi:hypothetical protein
VLLRLPGQGNQDLTVISATSTGEWKLHFECESRRLDKVEFRRIILLIFILMT